MILHGIWSSRACRFYLWAEQAPQSRTGRATRKAPRPHPYAVPVEALTADFGPRHSPARITLLLPTRDGKPVASPELARQIGATLDDGEGTEIAAWAVPALELPPEVILPWLATPRVEPSGPGGEEEASETAEEGADLRFWRRVGRLALGLLRRERWLPALERDAEGRFEARWQPALNLPEDAARLRAFAEAMPPACRALAETERPPTRLALLTHFLAAATDATIRSWSDGKPGSGAPPSRTTATAGRAQPTTAAAAWLAALHAPTGRVAERAENLRPLAAALGTWLQPAQASGEAGFRTCFRIDPPPAEDPEEASWSLSFWLQAIDEPSLLVPATQVWESGGRSLAALNRRWESPQERMLPALARAAHHFPPMARALKSRRPTGCSLSTPEAYEFLREVAPLLEETGNGVLAPDWWRRPAARLGMRVRMRTASRSAASGVLTQERLVEFDWQLALGDEPLTPEEFAQLASLKTPLVRLRGKWLEVRPDEVERAIRAWERRQQAGPIGLIEALRLPESADGLPVTAVDAEGELRQLLDRLQGEERPDPVAVPPHFEGTLRPYQQYGLEWLSFLRQWALGACLADDMGLGKTVQVFAYLLHARREGMPPALLVCPTSLVENWRREAARFAPALQVYVHHGAGRVRGGEGEAEENGVSSTFTSAIAGHDLVLTTYPLALRDEAVLRSVSWDTVILDEAQNIKNPETGQTRAIRGLEAGTRIAMTGTPVENRLSDLWSLMEFLNPGFLGPQREFRGRFAIPIERDGNAEVSDRLRRLTRPFLLRRVKTDPNVIRDLPEKQEMKVVCTLTAEQATLYEAVVSEMLEQADETEGIQRRGLVLAALSRLKQICNHPAHFLHDDSALPGRSGKLERLAEMLEEVLSVGEAALIFTQFAEWGERLRPYLQSRLRCEALFLHGGVPRKRRDEMVARFQSPEGPPLMLLSLKAGGVGLNLTRANHVFHFDRWWNPAVENQATDRAFRIGQTRAVQVHKFLCAGTLEDHIDAMIEQKRELAQNIVGAGEGWLTELGTAQLRELLTLRREGV